jgi:hypothetical protein
MPPVRREVGDTRHVWEGDDTANLGADAELQLRGQDPPIALVMNELKAMFALAKEISERIRASPTLREMFESELRDELESIARKLLDPKAKS